MMIRLDRFGGLVPRVHEKALPANNAQRADNCRLLSGALGAWRSREPVCALENPSTIKTIYLFNREHWLTWPEVVDVARGAIGGDATERTYFTGGPENQPQVIDINTALGGNEPAWEASRYYNAGDYIVPTVANGYRYEAGNSGFSGATEPVTWSTVVGNQTGDGAILWTTRALADYPTPAVQGQPAICWMLPEKSYHLGVPKPATAPVATRTAPQGSVLDVKEFSSVASGDNQNVFANVLHDGVTAQTIRVTISSRIKGSTPQTGTLTYTLSRVDSLGTTTLLQTEVVNAFTTADVFEPAFVYESGLPDTETFPERTLTVTETRPEGVYSYVTEITLAGIDPLDTEPNTVVHTVLWSSASEGSLTGLEIEIGPDHPFAVDDKILIFGVSGIDALNSEHLVTDVGPSSVMIILPAGVEVDAADYISGGTWKMLPSVENTIDRVYIYTYVAVMGGKYQEGPPSSPSTMIGVESGDEVVLTGLSAPPAGYNVSLMRIYRTVDGESEATYKFVAEIPVTLTYADTVPEDSALIGEEIQSITWSPPPADLSNIVEMPGGILAGTAGNEVCFCEPYQPHAWPLDYRKAVTGAPVALGAFGNSAVVLTDSFPYLITGTHPDSMSIDKLELAWACVSKRSVVDMGYAVAYASPDGLVSVGPGQLELVTRSLFSEREWQELKPESMLAARYDSAYVFFYDTGVTRGGYMFDPREPLATLTQLGFYADAAYTDNKTGTLYLVVEGELMAFNANHDALESYIWRSKRFVTRHAVNFSVAQVKADGYPVLFNLYSASEGSVRHRFTKLVMNDGPFRLPGGYRSGEWEIELSGDRDVTAVFLAETVGELRGA